MSGLCLYVSPLSGCLVFVWMSQLYRHLTFIWIRDLCLVRLNYPYLNVSPLCSISHSSLDVFPMSGSLVFSGFLVFIWTSGLCLDVWYLSGCLVFIWMFDLCLDVWPLPGCLDFLWMGLFLGNWPLSLCLIFVWNVSTLFTCMFVLCLDVLSLSDVWPLSECFNFIFDWIFYLCMNYWPLSWCLVFVWMSDLCLDVWPLSGCLHDLCLDVWPLSGCLDILWFEFQMSRSSNFIREKCVDRC